MFRSLGDRLQGVFDSLRGRGKLTEAEVKAALREVRVALLEADVNLEAAKAFTDRVQEKAIGSEALLSLNADQRVIAIVHEELINLLGGKQVEPKVESGRNIWMLMGLQGAGKTTTAGKLAYRYKQEGHRPLLVAADTQRPAARDQLRTLGEQIEVPVFEVRDNESALGIKTRLDDYLKTHNHNLIIVDTAGRLQIDEALMSALAELKQVLNPSETMLVIDAMTGQQSLPVAKSFDEQVGGLTGLIISKLDGDARGGAALSAKHVTGMPIYFAGMSEKIDGLELFYPDRIAGRILGMGDVLTLIEKAKVLEEDEDEIGDIKDFNLNDLLNQMRKMKKMGSFADILKLIPGVSRALPADFAIDEKQIGRIEAIMSSMTEEERKKPQLLNASRRKRVAAGSGTSVQAINQLMKQYESMKTMMRQMMGRRPGMGLGAKMSGGAAPMGPSGFTGGAFGKSSKKNTKKRKKRR
ncbi:MAG: signal recognition particle protein [Deinococcales bacterium]